MVSAGPIVAVENVYKSYSTSAGASVSVLAGIDLTIEAGDKISLVGASGSGKSTMLSLIAGLLRPDVGTVRIDGIALGSLGDAARAELRSQRIGIALQSDNLIPFLTARENVELALGFGPQRRAGRGARRATAEAKLQRFGVAHRGEHRPRHLSGGEAQRVALAVALANEPALLLADEVVGQLDGATAGRVVDEVMSGDFAVLYVTHDVSLADRVARRYQLDGGRIVAR